MVFVALEGYDGSGKDSVADRVAAVMGAKRINFPDDTEPVTGLIIREYLAKEWAVCRSVGENPLTVVDQGVGAVAFQSLQIVNRLARARWIREQRMNGGVVAVRYTQSGLIYGAMDGIDPVWLDSVQSVLPRPDLSILLDVDPEVSMERRAKRNLKPERYERDLDFAREVIERYRRHWKMTCDPVVDANQPLQCVIDDVLRLVFSRRR